MRRRRTAVAEPSQLRATMRCRHRRGRAVHQAAPPPLGEDEEAVDKCARLLGLISPESLNTGDFCGGDWNIGLVGAAAPPRAGGHGFEVGRGGEVNEKGKEHTDEGEEAGEGEIENGNNGRWPLIPPVKKMKMENSEGGMLGATVSMDARRCSMDPEDKLTAAKVAAISPPAHSLHPCRIHAGGRGRQIRGRATRNRVGSALP
uniref:Uncharacterized protein n=1 Tax=Oryza glumipatula TaxID=40148 RepID=A0A0E0AI24_9ORYZ